MSKFEFTGKTVEDAVEAGLKKLNLSIEDVDVKVVEEPVKKLIGGKKARVIVKERVSDGQRAVDFIDELLQKMNFVATGELVETDDLITINLITTNSSSIIGYRGEVLDAFQCLAGAVANIGREQYKRVVVDCENYRDKRQETLQNLARRLAKKAIAKGRKVTLEPMNPYERRVIHSTLSENEDIKTVSEGREPNRFIAIIPSNLRTFNDRTNRRGGAGDRKGQSRSGFKGERGDRPYNSRQKNSFPSENEEKANQETKPKSNLGFGTFLGNSFKDNN